MVQKSTKLSYNDLTQMPLTHLQGVGPALEKKLANLNLCRPLDLLFHLALSLSG